MSFVQLEFTAFLAVVLALYWSLPHRRAQNGLLVVASAVFYGWVHPWFLLLLYGSASLDFTLGQAIAAAPRRKRWFVALSLLGNLTLLGYFKYFGFFVENVVGAARALGVTAELGTLDVLLPVGISFYTFQTMGYTIDVARGELKPRRSFLDYVLYVSFFPQLVAGPIERAGHLLPQLERPRRFDLAQLRSGLGLALWGAFKKIVIADSLAPYVDKVFVLSEPAGPLLWAAVAAFGIQIYADFSGYTDMARGCARMLGIELVENFNAPFLARTTPELWQRWHMSLSFWIRDYVLGPLLGRGGEVGFFRFAWATVLTFALIGFWHGASWNFVLFGVYHGVWVVLYNVAVRRMPGWASRVPAGDWLARGFHLAAVGMVGSLLFREHHVDRIVRHLTTNPVAGTWEEWLATGVVVTVTGVACVPLLAGWVYDEWLREGVEESAWRVPLQHTAWALYAVGMGVLYRVDVQDFVYFQF